MEDMVDGQLLVAHKTELLAIADLVGRHLEQLGARSDLGLQEAVGVDCPRDRRRQAAAEELVERAPVRTGEEAARRGLRQQAEVGDLAGVGRVVQVRRPHHGVGLVLQDTEVVAEVVDVAADLSNRVQPRAPGGPWHLHQRRVALERGRLGPLLELDHHVGRLTGLWVHASQDDVGPS